MLENRKLTLLLSFLLACALWFYVVGQMNPVTRKTYRDIPVMLTNEQSLNDNGLAVLNASEDSFRVTLSGKRDVISKLSKSDITATVDLTNAAEGRNSIQIDIKIPDNVDIINQSLDEIDVNIEELVTKTKDVRVSFEGDYPKGQEPAALKTDPEAVTVSGAKTLVEKVSYVSAPVDVSYVTEELGSATCNLTPVTSGGSSVSNISLSDSICKVTSIMYETRSVKLTVPVTDNSNDDYTRTTSHPARIRVKAASNILKAINSVTSEPIDITGITENKKLPVTPALPEGVYVSDKDADIQLTVKVSKVKGRKLDTSGGKELKSFTFADGDVKLKNTGGAKFRTSPESLEVQITGTGEQLADIMSSDITLYADVSTVGSTGGQAEVTAKCAKDHADIAVIPSKISISVE